MCIAKTRAYRGKSGKKFIFVNFTYKLITLNVFLLQVVGEEIVVSASEHLLDKADCQVAEAAMYFEESLHNCKMEYEEPDTAIPLNGSSTVQRWDSEDIDMLSSKVLYVCEIIIS